jgi:hypothetical protein
MKTLHLFNSSKKRRHREFKDGLCTVSVLQVCLDLCALITFRTSVEGNAVLMPEKNCWNVLVSYP